MRFLRISPRYPVEKLWIRVGKLSKNRVDTKRYNTTGALRTPVAVAYAISNCNNELIFPSIRNRRAQIF